MTDDQSGAAEAERPSPEARPVRSEAVEETWRTLAGLLGRAWLARERPALSGGWAMAAEPTLRPEPGIPVGVGPPAEPVGGPEPPPAGGAGAPPAGPEATAAVRPRGGVASFVVDVATSQPSLDPATATRQRRATLALRNPRPLHCHLGGPHAHVSHNTCQRPALPPA